MLLTYPDKHSLWADTLDELAGSLEQGLWFLLHDQCYLDSLERGYAVIGTRTKALEGQVKLKAAKSIQNALSIVTGYPVRVEIAHANARIVEKHHERVSGYSANPDEQEQLHELHRQYGDIMGIVNNHPVFQQASKPLPRGGWGIFREILSDACREYGVITVLNGLRHVSAKGNVQKARALFLQELRAGAFGHKLAHSAPIFLDAPNSHELMA